MGAVLAADCQLLMPPSGEDNAPYYREFCMEVRVQGNTEKGGFWGLGPNSLLAKSG